MSPATDLVALRSDDAAEIAALMNRVWSSAYGAAGAPAFHESYLRWLYGGPDEADGALLGIRHEGVLVAFKVVLSRPALLGGQPVRAYQGTHLTIDPALPLRARLECLARIGEPHGLLPASAVVPTAPFAVGVAFYEEKKTIVQSTAGLMARHGLWRTFVPLQQHIVNPIALRPGAARATAAGCVVRAVTDADLPALAALHERAAARCSFAFTASVAQQRHRLLGLERSRALVVEEDGVITGLLHVILLELARAGRTSLVAVAEQLVFEGSLDATALLLASGAEAAAGYGARGLVVENTTALPADSLRPLGLVPSSRRMVLMLARRTPGDIPLDGGFLVDVK